MPEATKYAQPSATASVTYEGGLRTTAVHLRSGQALLTDAPVDNMGRGEAFSPTDLLAVSLLSCKLTTAAIAFQKRHWPEPHLSGTVNKIMADNPRRVARLEVAIHAHDVLDDDRRKVLEAAAKACPVAKSLASDVTIDLVFHYPNA